MPYKVSARQAGRLAEAREIQKRHEKLGHSSPSYKDCAGCQKKKGRKS